MKNSVGDSAISNPEAHAWSQHSTEGPGQWRGEQSSATAVWMGMHGEGCRVLLRSCGAEPAFWCSSRVKHQCHTLVHVLESL